MKRTAIVWGVLVMTMLGWSAGGSGLASGQEKAGQPERAGASAKKRQLLRVVVIGLPGRGNALAAAHLSKFSR